MGFLRRVEGNMFIFRVNLAHVTPQINHLGKMSIFLRVSIHIYGVSKEDRWENVHFLSNPRHVTPQIDSSWKNEHCSEGLNTHLWGFSRR